MKSKTFVWLLSFLLVAVVGSFYLNGCSKDKSSGFFIPMGAVTGGSGSTGAITFNQGVVTNAGNGTMTVNGMNITTGQASIMMNNAPGTSGDLMPGQVVTMRGIADGASGDASQVALFDDLTGPVSAVSGALGPNTASTAMMTVLGQTIAIDGNTLFEPADTAFSGIMTGSIVEVSGLPDANGVIHATLVRSEPTASFYTIRGIVSNATVTSAEASFTLTPNGGGNPLMVSLSTGTTGTGGAVIPLLLDGQKVNVAIDPAAYPSPFTETTVTADSVTIDNPLLPAEGDMVFIVGFATAPTGTGAEANTFAVDGITVNGNSLASGGTLTIPEDRPLAVHGTFTNGEVAADLIEPAGATVLTIGAIESVNDAKSMIVAGKVIDLNFSSIQMNGLTATAAELHPGRQVVVKSAVNNFATVFNPGLESIVTGTTGTAGTGGALTDLAQQAISVLIIDNVQGPVTAMTGTLTTALTGTGITTGTAATLTVFQQTITADQFTRFGSALSGLITSTTGSGGVTTLATGTVVDASGIGDGSGGLLATYLETGPTATDYHVVGLVTGASGSPVTNFTLNFMPGGGTSLSVALATEAIPATPAITDGMIVNVVVDPLTFLSPFTQTAITAKSVNPVNVPFGAANDTVVVQGLVTGLSGDLFEVNGVDVNGSDVTGGMPALINNASRVRVTGTISPVDGTLQASEIQVQ